MASIFEIERRKDLKACFADFFADLSIPVALLDGDTLPLYDYLNLCIRTWPYRCGAVGINAYLKAIDVDITSSTGERDYLLTLELIINLLYWAVDTDKADSGFRYLVGTSDLEEEVSRLIENAESILEQCCNMKIREEDAEPFPKYYITRRNTAVDAAAVAVPELSDILLGYFDLRNEDCLEGNISALSAIYKYMEPDRYRVYRGLSSSAISEEFFTSMNSFCIRHNNKDQKILSSNETKEICDKLFLMAVYVLQTLDVNQYKEELKSLREPGK